MAESAEAVADAGRRANDAEAAAAELREQLEQLSEMSDRASRDQTKARELQEALNASEGRIQILVQRRHSSAKYSLDACTQNPCCVTAEGADCYPEPVANSRHDTLREILVRKKTEGILPLATVQMRER